jgi:hypothetical protein
MRSIMLVGTIVVKAKIVAVQGNFRRVVHNPLCKMGERNDGQAANKPAAPTAIISRFSTMNGREQPTEGN